MSTSRAAWYDTARSAALHRIHCKFPPRPDTEDRNDWRSEMHRYEENKKNCAAEWESFCDRVERRDEILRLKLSQESAPSMATRAHDDATLVPWTPLLRTLFCGVGDLQSPLSLLGGHENTILKTIHELAVQEEWIDSVKITCPAWVLGWRHQRPRFQEVAFSSCAIVQFPDPENRNINMMPFIMGDPQSLPMSLRSYYDCIISKCPVEEKEYGKVCYLTIQESIVSEGTTQRRGGLHVEAPGSQSAGSLRPGSMIDWGGCGSVDRNRGGIFMASTVANSTRMFDALVVNHKAVNGHGGIEHLRPYLLGKGTLLKANELVCFTDRTPHEALPLTSEGYRQFFRLVTSQLSVWYEQHSTANPLVPLPDKVRVIRESKFKNKK